MSGFELASSGSVALLESIGKLIDGNETRTFVCHTCLDKGVTVRSYKCRVGYMATVAPPCQMCSRGDTISKGRAKGRIEQRAMGDGPNTLLNRKFGGKVEDL